MPFLHSRFRTAIAFRLAAGSVSARLQLVNDSVHIECLEIFAHVGVPDEERSVPQRLVLNLTFWPKRQAAELGDSIERAVNYAAVCDEVKKFIEQRRDKLIETMADALARQLLQRFEIWKITIELRKFVLPQTEFVSVTVTREKEIADR